MTGLVATHGIKVLGRDLQVKSAASAERVAEVEALVNAKLAEAETALNSGDTQLVVILTLMNLAEMYLALQRGSQEQEQALNRRIEVLMARIEAQLA